MEDSDTGSLVAWIVAGFTALGAVLTAALKWEGLRSKVASHDHRIEDSERLIESIRADISEIKTSLATLAARGE